MMLIIVYKFLTKKSSPRKNSRARVPQFEAYYHFREWGLYCDIEGEIGGN